MDGSEYSVAVRARLAVVYVVYRCAIEKRNAFHL
jgi:hypothetical protein